MESRSTEELIRMAKLAEQAERYDDMVSAMKEIVTKEPALCSESRNLLSVAYKNVIGARRASWRIIKSIESNQEDGSAKQNQAKKYREQIEKELLDQCQDVLKLLDKFLLPQTEQAEDDAMENLESKVFYYKMKGDYWRYLAEVSEDDRRKNSREQALAAYKEAVDSAKKLQSTHPIRLGLALNFSVFYYEIMGDPTKACNVAKEAFDNALSELDNLKDESYKDSTLILQLIRDNLTLWTSDSEAEGEKVEDLEEPQE